MSKNNGRRPQASKIWESKPRNYIAKALRHDNEFRPKVIKDQRKKKPKYPIKVDFSEE